MEKHNPIDLIVTYPLPLVYEKNKIIFILITGVIFLILGTSISTENSKIFSQEFSYDSTCINGQTCQFNHVIQQDISAPIYFYYKLTNVYQNHRTFVTNIDLAQVGGEYVASVPCKAYLPDEDYCFPEPIVDAGKTLVPAGLQGWSFFNDKINITISNDEEVCNDGSVGSECLDKSDIALAVDKEFRFGDDSGVFDPQYNTREFHDLTNSDDEILRHGDSIPELTDQSLMVWMRYAATKDFTKLFGVINHDLKANDNVQFSIDNKFNTEPFGGSKSFVISNASKFGGQQRTLALLFIISGVVTLLLLAGIIATHYYFTLKYAPVEQAL